MALLLGIRRRARLAAAVGVIAVALIAWFASQQGTAAATLAGTAGGYRDPAGWSLRYPGGMSIESSTNGPGMVTFYEVTVANFRQMDAIRSGRTADGAYVQTDAPLDSAGRYPADGVAFRMESIDGGPGQLGDAPDARFPITPATFVRDPGPVDVSHGVPRSESRQVLADGQQWTATVWAGSQATPRSRLLLARVIASLRFPHLHPGERAGDFVVLGRASEDPVGSFTLVHAPGAVCPGSVNGCHRSRQPFYLIHAPGRLPASMQEPDMCPTARSCSPVGAFYPVSWTWEYILGGYISRCDLRLDRSTDEFWCTNLAARWDRLGRPILVPPHVRFPESLQVAFAKVSWDGYVMLLPGLGANPPNRSGARQLWPGWPGAAQ